MANRKFTQEFKDSTIQLALNSEKSVLKIGADLDVNPKTIYNWIREYKIANNLPVNTISITKSTTKETVDEENKRLRAENKLLKQERDILKKATAYFAREVL
ncbi:MAG: transposase [Flavobacteriaceae bacterium]|nr:transposase [Flavobacteriaceae bacterium]